VQHFNIQSMYNVARGLIGTAKARAQSECCIEGSRVQHHIMLVKDANLPTVPAHGLQELQKRVKNTNSGAGPASTSGRIDPASDYGLGLEDSWDLADDAYTPFPGNGGAPTPTDSMSVEQWNELWNRVTTVHFIFCKEPTRGGGCHCLAPPRVGMKWTMLMWWIACIAWRYLLINTKLLFQLLLCCDDYYILVWSQDRL